MRQIAKWTILCVICTLFGFGATYLVANNDRALQAVVAMLPAPKPDTTVEELALDDSLAKATGADVMSAEATNVKLAGVMAAAEAPALLADGTVGTLAAGAPVFQSDRLQTTPSNGPLTAVGVISVVRDRQVVLAADGRVDDVAVEVGDEVSAGDLLVSLDTTYLDWAVEQAEIAFEKARIDFEEAGELVDDADIEVAEANLLLAQENLAEVEAGPTAATLAAAESAAVAAWAEVEELQAGPNPNEMIIAQAALRRAEIAVEAAQREYDKIAWLPEAAATTAADNLQDATIDLEAARAAFDETTKPPTEATIQSAIAGAQSAQAELDELRLQPTPASLAAARAAVSEAEAELANVMEGPQQGAVRQAELSVREAMIALEDARLAQAAATVTAPVDGTVLAVNVDIGQQASDGTVVVVLADTSNVKLTVNVEQRDIARVAIGQAVDIAIYALANDRFAGVVEKIAPLADAETGFVTFPVIIRFTEGPMEKVLPGMTASATFMPEGAPDSSAAPAATAEATEEAPAEATEEATEEAEATAEVTEEPAEEATEEATPTATEESEEEAEEPTVDATATPLPEADATATPSN